MQLKIYRKSTLLLTLIIIIDILGILLLLKYRTIYPDKKLLMTVLYILAVITLMSIYSYFDLNTDKNIIKKRVSNGDVALAKIKDGSFVRFARDARLQNHVYWKLNVDVYDNDMNKHETSIIEKFDLSQTSIPKGYVYVTYQENKLDECLIIPNVIISSIPEYQPLVQDYEDKIKPKYLNAYIKNGLILENYKDTLKK